VQVKAEAVTSYPSPAPSTPPLDIVGSSTPVTAPYPYHTLQSNAHADDRLALYDSQCEVRDLKDEINHRRINQTQIEDEIRGQGIELTKMAVENTRLDRELQSRIYIHREDKEELYETKLQLNEYKKKFNSPHTGYWADQADAWI
jgi:hypothetical protein